MSSQTQIESFSIARPVPGSTEFWNSWICLKHQWVIRVINELIQVNPVHSFLSVFRNCRSGSRNRLLSSKIFQFLSFVLLFSIFVPTFCRWIPRRFQIMYSFTQDVWWDLYLPAVKFGWSVWRHEFSRREQLEDANFSTECRLQDVSKPNKHRIWLIRLLNIISLQRRSHSKFGYANQSL